MKKVPIQSITAQRASRVADCRRSANSMTPLKPLTLVACISLLAGCATVPSDQPKVVRYQPREGDQTTMSPVFLSDVDTKPVPLFAPGPDLSYDPKFTGTVVEVVFEITISPTGVVTESKLISSAPDFVGASVAASYLRAKFRPAKKDGVPVPCRVRMSQSFRL